MTAPGRGPETSGGATGHGSASGAAEPEVAQPLAAAQLTPGAVSWHGAGVPTATRAPGPRACQWLALRGCSAPMAQGGAA